AFGITSENRLSTTVAFELTTFYSLRYRLNDWRVARSTRNREHWINPLTTRPSLLDSTVADCFSERLACYKRSSHPYERQRLPRAGTSDVPAVIENLGSLTWIRTYIYEAERPGPKMI